MRSPWPTAAFVLGLLPVLVGGEDGVSYRYVRPERLARDLAPDSPVLREVIGKPVEVVDELVKVWEHQPHRDLFRFDTVHLRCTVASTDTESMDLIKSLAKEREEGRFRPPLVVLVGTPVRATEWGGVATDAQGRVETEAVVLRVDRVESARERHYQDWLDRRRRGE